MRRRRDMREPKAKKAIWNESLNVRQGKDRQVPVQTKDDLEQDQ